MSQYLIEKLSAEYNFSKKEKDILYKSKRELTKEERKIFYQRLNPDRRRHREWLMEQYEKLGSEEREKWFTVTVESMLEKGGEADIADELVLDIIGRIKIYSELKEKAKKEGKPVKALAGGGGCLFFLTLGVMIITVIVYFAYS